jgi:HSP20 family protein
MALTDLIPWHRDRSVTMPFGDAADPFAALQREMTRLFDDFSRGLGAPLPARGGFAAAWPHVDVSETGTEVKVAAELPGLTEKDVEVSLHDGVLTIKGEKRAQSDGAFYSERWQGQFQRSIRLGPSVDPERVSATFSNGVLSVTLAKRPEAQNDVKRIPIAAS